MNYQHTFYADFSILDLGCDEFREALIASVREIAATATATGLAGKEFPKEIAYMHAMEHWAKVSEESHQTIDDLMMSRAKVSEVIARYVSSCTIVNMGTGDAFEKPCVYIDACLSRKLRCTYIAHDLNKASIEAHLRKMTERYPNLRIMGVVGSFEQLDRCLASNTLLLLRFDPPYLFLNLGGSFFNARKEIRQRRVKALEGYVTESDCVLVSQDAPSAPDDVAKAKARYTTEANIQFIGSSMETLDKIMRGAHKTRDIAGIWSPASKMTTHLHKWDMTNLQEIDLWNGSAMPSSCSIPFFESHKLSSVEIKADHQQAGDKIFVSELATASKVGCSGGTMAQFILTFPNVSALIQHWASMEFNGIDARSCLIDLDNYRLTQATIGEVNVADIFDSDSESAHDSATDFIDQKWQNLDERGYTINSDAIRHVIIIMNKGFGRDPMPAGVADEVISQQLGGLRE